MQDTQTLTEARIARLAEQADVNFGPLASYRRLVGGDGVPIFTGIQTCEPGYMTRMHWHPYVEALFVIEGEATVYLEGREAQAQRLTAGDIVALPPNIPHVFGNPGTRTLRMLGIHSSPERIVNFVDGTKTGAHGFVDYGVDTGQPVAPAAAGPALWRGLDAAQMVRLFDNRAAVPDGDAHFKARAERSVPLRTSLPGERDVRYGPGPRQLVDVYAGAPGGPVVLFFHGGGWRNQSKEAFAFVAEPLVAEGITTVVAGYDLFPQVGMLDIMREAREVVAWTCRTLAPQGGRRVVLAGHSSGAQLAGMTLTHDFRREGLARTPVQGALLISGSHDMEPHRHHPRYLDMGLDEVLVQKTSTLRNPPLDTDVELVVAVGAAETSGYVRQSTEYCEAMAARGHRAELLLSPGDNHFSVIGRLGEADHPLTRRLVALARGRG
ncbi:MAG: cupin domain-containing protein [Betaproteobacteria bacterium]|nr:cupin domain-containing protein [Betaproteobacteria bacterium]